MIFKKEKIQRYKSEKKEWRVCLIPHEKNIVIIYEDTRYEATIFTEEESAFVWGYLAATYPSKEMSLKQDLNHYYAVPKNNLEIKKEIMPDKQKLLRILQTSLKKINEKGGSLKKIGFGVLVSIVGLNNDVWAEKGIDFKEAFYKSFGSAKRKNPSYAPQIIYSSEDFNSQQIEELVTLGFKVFLTRKGCSQMVIETAKRKNLILVGFVRNNRFSFFTNNK